MKKIFAAFCLTTCFVLPAFAQGYKVAEPYDTSANSGKPISKSTQKYTYLYDTTLIQAIKQKDEHRVKMLMYAQVNPNEKNDEGFTPLFFAAQYLSPESMALLLDRGAKVNLTSTYNLTPLMSAAAAGRADNVKLLLEYGADPNMLDDKKLTALDHAFNNHQIDTAVLLSPVTTIIAVPDSDEVLNLENSNGKAALEHTSSASVYEDDSDLFVADTQDYKEEVYNPTLDEIDAKIEQTRQALARLIALRKQIVDSEEAALVRQTKPSKSVQTKTKTTTTTKTTTKTNSSRFGKGS